MRSVLAFLVLMSMGAPTVAASAHHARARHHVAVHPDAHVAVPSGWYTFPGYPPIPPSENRNLDPSNFGGA